MKIAIICSKADLASTNIYNCLKDRIKPSMGEHDVSLYFLEQETIHLEHLDKKIDCDLMIFCAMHTSKAGVAALTVHVQGNFGLAVLGGKEKTLVTAPTTWMKQAFKLIEKKAKDSHYEVILEATHHGPYVSVPSFFVEIGSSEEAWNDKLTGKLMADVLVELLKHEIPDCKSAVAIGGLHHGPSFKKVMLNSEYGVGHIIPKYNLEYLNEEMLLQAIEKSLPKADLVILDWKGLGKHKEKIKEILEKNEINWKKTKSKDFKV